MITSHPESEFTRRVSLDRYHVLNTAPQRAYDEVVSLAVQLCAAPVAFLAFVAGEHLWLKSRMGMGASEISRKEGLSFFELEESEAGFAQVQDARQDTRFAFWTSRKNPEERCSPSLKRRDA